MSLWLNSLVSLFIFVMKNKGNALIIYVRQKESISGDQCLTDMWDPHAWDPHVSETLVSWDHLIQDFSVCQHILLDYYASICLIHLNWSKLAKIYHRLWGFFSSSKLLIFIFANDFGFSLCKVDLKRIFKGLRFM